MEQKQEDGRIVTWTSWTDGGGDRLPAAGSDAVDIVSTYVAPSLRGQGIADKLMRAALENIQARGLKTYTSCEYAERCFPSIRILPSSEE